MNTVNFHYRKISYPLPAPGWTGGIYYPREASVEAVDHPVSFICRSWKEIEETGYGTYYYEETIACHTTLSGCNYHVDAILSTPLKHPCKIHIRINSVVKSDSVLLLPGQSTKISIPIYLTDGNFLFSVCAGAMEEIDREPVSSEVTVENISLTELPLKQSKNKPHIFLVSDSTVQTYEKAFYPQTGWGQVFYEFWQDTDTHRELSCPNCPYPQARIYETSLVCIENRSIGGRSAKSFLEEGKLDSCLSELTPGDYMFVQFAHNDATSIRPNRYTPPELYKYYLSLYIEACNRRKAICVLVTPVAMRIPDENGSFPISFSAYREKMLELGKEYHIPVLDLGKASADYLNQHKEESKEIYLWLSPGEYPEGAYADGVSDNAHLQLYGAKIYANLAARLIAAYETDHQLDALKQLIRPASFIPKPHRASVSSQYRPADYISGFVVQEISIEQQTGSFLLNWNTVENAVSYHVYAKKDADATYQIVKTITKQEKNSAALLPFTNKTGCSYQYYVTAVFPNGTEGTASRIITIDLSAKPE